MLQFVNQIRDLSGTAQAEALECYPCATPGMKNCDDARNTELQAVRNEVDFDMCSTLKIDSGSFDKASGEAEVEDPAAQQETSVGQKDLGPSFAGVALMAATVWRWLMGRRCLIVHGLEAR